jgi:hypothetical protein
MAQTGKDIEQERSIKGEAQKFTIQKYNEIPDAITTAQNKATLGTQLYDSVNGNEAAFGILRQNPTLSKALANFLESGVKVGNFQAGFPIEESLRKSLPQDQQLAVQKVESLLNQVAIDQASKMKGSVSNYEDKMVKSVYGTPSNSAEFLKYIAIRQKIQGQYEQDIANDFYQFHKAHPEDTYTDFMLNKNTKQMRQHYEDAIEHAAKMSYQQMGGK